MRKLLLLLPLAACSSKNSDPPPPSNVPVVEIGPIKRPADIADPVIVERPSNTPPANAVPQLGPGGSRRVSDGNYWYGTGPGYVYSCHFDELHAWPKNGGPEISRGPCHGAFQFLGDASGTYFCDTDGVKRIPAQGDPELVAGGESCILDAIDESYVYYVVPGFDSIPNPGLYRVAKTGGDPTKLYATRKGEQVFVVLDGDQLWMGAWGAGTISTMPKAGGPLKTVVTGQKGIVDLAIDGDSLYWYPETTKEIRKRAKRGGPIKVIANNIEQEPILIQNGSLYWYRAEDATRKTLLRLAPGAKTPTVLVPGLDNPTLVIDNEGIYFSEYDKPGVYMLPLPE